MLIKTAKFISNNPVKKQSTQSIENRTAKEILTQQPDFIMKASAKEMIIERKLFKDLIKGLGLENNNERIFLIMARLMKNINNLYLTIRFYRSKGYFDREYIERYFTDLYTIYDFHTKKDIKQIKELNKDFMKDSRINHKVKKLISTSIKLNNKILVYIKNVIRNSESNWTFNNCMRELEDLLRDNLTDLEDDIQKILKQLTNINVNQKP